VRSPDHNQQEGECWLFEEDAMTGAPKQLFPSQADGSHGESWLVVRDAIPGALLLVVWMALWAGVAIAVTAPPAAGPASEPRVIASSQVIPV
jgi:hypothetical protein